MADRNRDIRGITDVGWGFQIQVSGLDYKKTSTLFGGDD